MKENDDLISRLRAHPESLGITEHKSVGLEAFLFGQIKVSGLGVCGQVLFLRECGDTKLVTEAAKYTFSEERLSAGSGA